VTPYTFYLHEALREQPSFQFIRCEDDEHARTLAHGLFGNLPGLIEVVVYDGGRNRFRVERPDGGRALHAGD
jgi:hypothetical protein